MAKPEDLVIGTKPERGLLSTATHGVSLNQGDTLCRHHGSLPIPTESPPRSVFYQDPPLISWDTGSNVKGKVHLSTAPGTSEVFADGGEPGGARSGSKPKAIELGTNYLFQLKRADNPNVLLATVLVEGRNRWDCL